MPWILLFFVLAIIEALPVDVSCVRLADIYWNATNPIFRIDNTDHIIDVNKGNIPFEYDQVNIICPVYRTGTQEEDVERYIIYNVSKEEYDSCRITNPTPRIIAVCDKPHQLMYFTITFRSFTPQPGGARVQTRTGLLLHLHLDGKRRGAAPAHRRPMRHPQHEGHLQGLLRPEQEHHISAPLDDDKHRRCLRPCHPRFPVTSCRRTGGGRGRPMRRAQCCRPGPQRDPGPRGCRPRLCPRSPRCPLRGGGPCSRRDRRRTGPSRRTTCPWRTASSLPRRPQRTETSCQTKREPRTRSW
ncbi:hypothetical protein MTO96_004779 [Rhipicephalus appendiculatus]